MHPPSLPRRLLRRAALALALATVCAATPPPPASVTLVGTFESEQGCPGDWDPTCVSTHLTRNAVDGVFRDFFTMPEGHHEFKVALNNSWDENYGANATRDGANLQFDAPAGLVVKFFYDPVTHWVTSSSNSAIAVLAGNFQKALGCGDDWQPQCLVTWLQDPDGDGVLRFSTAALPPGSYAVKVAHNESWDENYGAFGEPAGADIPFAVPVAGLQVDFTYVASTHQLSIAVPAATRTALTVSKNRIAVGETTLLTAQVTFPEGVGTPSGFVEFDIDAGRTTQGVWLDGGGVAQLQLQGVNVGSHTVVARYFGTYLTSGTSEQTLVVYQPATATAALELAPTSAVSGQPVTLTAKVATADASAGTPSGSVTFLEGTTELGTVQLDANGRAALTRAFSVGTHTLKAAYSGDSTFTAVTSSEQPLQVAKADSAVQLTSSQPSTVYGQSFTLTAQVGAVAPGGGVPSGRVTFQDGTTALGEATLDGSGRATLSTSTLSVGTHTVTASYGGDDGFEVSASASVSQRVSAAASRTTLTADKSGTVSGESVTLHAVVEPVAPGAGLPSGSVTFKDGTTVLGTVALDASGAADFSTSALGAGTHTLSAQYAGDTRFTSSTSASVSVQVARGATTTSLQMAPQAPTTGQQVSFTVQVSAVAPASGTPTGLVRLKDGGALVASAPLQSGTVTLTKSSLAPGQHAFSVDYVGDVSFEGSTSPTLNGTVVRAGSTVALAASPNPSTSGQTVTLTAQVSLDAGTSLTPTGSITFREGSAVKGTVTLDASGRASLDVTLEAGTHSLTASYSGDANIDASTSQALSQTVSRGTTSTALSSSPNPSSFGQLVTLTARVTVVAPAQGTPSGDVLFKADGAALGTGTLGADNTATFSTTALAAGTHLLTAEYAGDTRFAGSTSAALAQTVATVETPDAGTAVDAGTPTDAGTQTGTDAGTSADAGTQTGTDAGTQPETDAGTQTGSDAGTQPGTDAGTTADAGTQPGTDAGIGATNTPPPTEAAGGCGCTAGDGSASGFMLMLGAWMSLSVLRRRAGRHG